MSKTIIHEHDGIEISVNKDVEIGDEADLASLLLDATNSCAMKFASHLKNPEHFMI